MKEVESKEVKDVSGGGIIPNLTIPIPGTDYPLPGFPGDCLGPTPTVPAVPVFDRTL